MYRIVITDHFKRQLKKLVKKDRNLKQELIFVLKDFEKKKFTAIGKDIFKLRMRGQGRGKSGGYRLYVFVMEVEGILTPICIYSKNKCENMLVSELIEHLEKAKTELETQL